MKKPKNLSDELVKAEKNLLANVKSEIHARYVKVRRYNGKGFIVKFFAIFFSYF